MAKRFSANCPISYRPTNDSSQHKKNILDYIFSGYETCDSSVELRDICLQTDIMMSEWDNQYFESVIEKFTSLKEFGDTPQVEEFADVIESGDEDFYSVKEEKLEKIRMVAPHSICIQLKDSPHIILEDGTHKTKISLSNNYLEQNGLELTIGEGPEGNVMLKAGDAEIFPSDKGLPPGIIISVSDEKMPEQKDAEVETSPDGGEKIKNQNIQSHGRKIGLLSLVVDNLEQQNIDYYAEEMDYSPGGRIVKCVSDYNYLKEYDKREVGIFEKKDKKPLGKIQSVIAEIAKEQKDPEMVKIKEKELYQRVKKKFFKSALEGDPRMDYVKRELIDELVRKGYDKPEPEKFKSSEVQTEVHIDPEANDDFSFSDDSDSLLKRYYALRDFSALSYSVQENYSQQNKEKTGGNSNTHDATMGQLDPDFSTKTERTMEGISELIEISELGNSKEKDYVTEDEVSEISTKVKKSHSITSIEKRSKLVDTEEFDNDGIRDLANVSDRELRSPSLLKALKSFDEELNPLKQELSKLLSDFKSIDIPQDVQISVAEGRRPELSSSLAIPPDQSYPDRDESIHHLYRTDIPIRDQPCNCAPGVCLGFSRSSGIICQRIRRLPPTASSSEFFREFTRPSWISGTFRPSSIFSEPEDIYGDRTRPHTPSNMSIHNKNFHNKPDLN